jgi:hypothetical protein
VVAPAAQNQDRARLPTALDLAQSMTMLDVGNVTGSPSTNPRRLEDVAGAVRSLRIEPAIHHAYARWRLGRKRICHVWRLRPDLLRVADSPTRRRR